jgi:signal peptidase I
MEIIKSLQRFIRSRKEKKLKRKKERAKLTPAQKIYNFFRELVIVFAIFLVLNSFVIASFEVPTSSMEDTVMAGDFLFVNKFIYNLASPRNIPLTSIRLPYFVIPSLWKVERGDVVVFEFPGYRDEVRHPGLIYYLKRCVGLPGDTIEIIDKILYVNGELFPNPKYAKFERSYIYPKGQSDPRIFPKGAPFNEDNYGPIVVPKKGDTIYIDESNYEQWEIFIKREGHQIEIKDGKIFIDGIQRNIYVVEHDYYFMLGDNRDNSLDSRFWGFVPDKNIVGSPLIVYWSWDPNIPIYDIFSKLASIKFNRIGVIIK